jgi:site-specific DNA-methyltransferase (adenine-specific)
VRSWHGEPDALVEYRGVVWCITVPSGAFVARRNGVVFVTGNSGFPKSKALLKPAWEPIVMARKPGPLRDLDIDGCRIGTDEDNSRTPSLVADTPAGMGKGLAMGGNGHPAGRWPANVVLTDPVFDGGWEGVVGGGWQSGGGNPPSRRRETNGYEGRWGTQETGREPFDIEGTYSRFFLVPKASRSDREPVMPGMLEERIEPKIARRGKCVECGRWMDAGETSCPCGGEYEYESNGPRHRRNVHPTVKPIELMRHLVRLVTPSGGTVLDPFGGSGTTALAAEQEGRDWVLIEREAEYVRIAEARLSGWQRGLGLDVEVA